MATPSWLSDSVGEGLRKVTMTSICLSVCEKAVPQLPTCCQTLQFIPVCQWCLSSCYPKGTRAQRECICVSCMWVLWGELLGTLEFSSTDSISSGFCSQKVRELIFLALESWAVWPGMELGLLAPQNIPPKFLSTTCGYGTSPFHITPPTNLDGCGFFNSVIVRLPFNSISDGSKRWLFYILGVILMWLCEDMSRVYLLHHRDWKFRGDVEQSCKCTINNWIV